RPDRRAVGCDLDAAPMAARPKSTRLEHAPVLQLDDLVRDELELCPRLEERPQEFSGLVATAIHAAHRAPRVREVDFKVLADRVGEGFEVNLVDRVHYAAHGLDAL